MINKICTATEALAAVQDGALVAANFWGPGTPYYLLRALFEQGAKDLTVCIDNYNPMPDVVRAKGSPDPTLLLPQTKKVIAGFSTALSAIGRSDIAGATEIFKRVEQGTIEFECTSHGILIERLHAGAMRLGGIYSPIGIGTVVEEGKEKRVINGIEYIFQEPIVPDVGLVSATKADKLGNLVYHGTARGANPIIAMASRYTVAEVFEIVEPGELDPDTIVTPGIFVDRIVRIPEDDTTSKSRRLEWILARIEYRQQQEAEAAVTRGGNV